MFGYDDIDLPFILFPRLNLDKDTADSDLGYMFETVRYEDPDCDLDHPFLVGPELSFTRCPVSHLWKYGVCGCEYPLGLAETLGTYVPLLLNMYFPSTTQLIVDKFRANSPDLINLHKLGYDLPREIKRCLGHKVDNPFVIFRLTTPDLARDSGYIKLEVKVFGMLFETFPWSARYNFGDITENVLDDSLDAQVDAAMHEFETALDARRASCQQVYLASDNAKLVDGPSC